MTNNRDRNGNEYMEVENPPITESGDPRGCFMKCCLPGPAVFAWQGCDNCCHSFLACFCGCFFTFCCWNPAPRQKKFKPLKQEKQCCCCECNPQDCCCRFWCPCHTIYGHQGFDSVLDTVVMLVLGAGSLGPHISGLLRLIVAAARGAMVVPSNVNDANIRAAHWQAELVQLGFVTAALFGAYHTFGCYACACWVPTPTQKVWGMKPMVGKAVEGKPAAVGQAVAGQHQALPAAGGTSEGNYGSFLNLNNDD